MDGTTPDSTLAIGDQVFASASIVIDPAAAVKRMHGKWPWLLPFLILAVAGMAFALMVGPIGVRITQLNPPEGVTAEQLEKSMGMTTMIQRVMALASPLFVLLKLSVIGGLMTALSSMMDVKATFKNMFTLVAYCSLISVLQIVASAVVIMSKANQLTNLTQLQPPFGLDLVFTETSKPVWAIMNYFSIFTIWYLVVLVFAYAFMTGASRSKAVMAVTPAWLIPLLFAVAGSLFQR